MKRAQLVSPGTLERILRTADEAKNRRDFQQCVEILERASRLDPANTILLVNLGHAHGTNFDAPAAERCFERALRLSPKKTETLVAAGIRARDFGNLKMAEHYFQSASLQPDVSAQVLTDLAELYERLSRTNEATELVGRALHLSPNFPAALLARARLERQAGHLSEAEKLLASFPTEADREVRTKAYYELGGILDRQGRYDDAMAAFESAKTLMRTDASRMIYERKVMRDRLKQFRNEINASILKEWVEAGKTLQPAARLALLCGHPRSGTTLLEQVLDSHPAAVSAEETDIFRDFAYLPLSRRFPDDVPILTFLQSATMESLELSRKHYFRAIESFLSAPVAGRLLVDKNPSLTYLMAGMIRVFPEVKFLIAMRDPRDVCLSCYMQPFAPVGATSSAYLDLGTTVEEYIELMEMYRAIASQMQNPHLVVRYEDMVQDLEGVAKKVLDFLGLQWDPNVLKFHEHARQKMVRSPTYADVKTPVFKRAVGRWHHYEKYLAPHLEKLEPFVKAFGYEV